MKKAILIMTIALTVTGCATKPQNFIGELDPNDKKYKSKECSDVRLKSLDYDDRVGSRVAIGIASGLLLGPFGLPIAVATDASQNAERAAWNREIHARCSSKPLPDSLKQSPKTEPTSG